MHGISVLIDVAQGRPETSLYISDRLLCKAPGKAAFLLHQRDETIGSVGKPMVSLLVLRKVHVGASSLQSLLLDNIV